MLPKLVFVGAVEEKPNPVADVVAVDPKLNEGAGVPKEIFDCPNNAENMIFYIILHIHENTTYSLGHQVHVN